MISPPRDEADLMARAGALRGRSIADLADAVGARVGGSTTRTKGKVGELLERLLGATAGSASIPDFPHLGVELKSIPIDLRGRPRESTFVCAIDLEDADRAEWETSRVRGKLARVLFVPVEIPDASAPPDARRIGEPRLWRPSAEQEAILRGDFDELMGAIGMGGIEGVSAHAGRWLQVRPKAATGRVRTRAFGPDGEWLATVPRGFYLRARFTEAILHDPAAVP